MVYKQLSLGILCVDQALRPELVARINEKVVFSRLRFEVQREICELMVSREVERLRQLGHEIAFTPGMMEDLIREGFDRTLGARPMRNVVERHLQDQVVSTLMKSV